MLKILTLSVFFSWTCLPKPMSEFSDSASVTLRHQMSSTVQTISRTLPFKTIVSLEENELVFKFEHSVSDIDLLILSLAGEFILAEKLIEREELSVNISEFKQGSYFVNLINRAQKMERNTYKLIVGN